MPSVVYSPDFRSDAAEVWDYIGTESPERADAVLDAVEETISLLLQHSHIGRTRDHIGPGVRSFLAASRYVIYYRVLPDGIEALRLLHTSRDLEGLF